MANASAVIGYKTPNGDFRGTLVASDGWPKSVLGELRKKLSERGFKKVVEWIEAGAFSGGYDSVFDESPVEGEQPLLDGTVAEYVYEVGPMGVIPLGKTPSDWWSL